MVCWLSCRLAIRGLKRLTSLGGGVELIDAFTEVAAILSGEYEDEGHSEGMISLTGFEKRRSEGSTTTKGFPEAFGEEV